MMDPKQRNKLLLIAAAFVAVVIVIIIAAVVFNQQNDLPPTKNQSSPSSADPSASDTPDDEATVFKDGIKFEHFDELQRYAIPTYRIDAIQSTLATYGNNRQLNSFAMDTASVNEQEDGERTIFTFNATSDRGETYKVELSYTYTADAYVRLFNSKGEAIQTSPYD